MASCQNTTRNNFVKCLKIIWPLLLFQSGTFCLAAERVPVVAIICDPALQKEGDLITAELSQKPGVQLVEREKILAITTEQKLRASGITEKGSIELGKLLSADGVLFIAAAEQDGLAVIDVRLVAVHPGIVIEEMIVRCKDDLPAVTAVQVASRIVPLLPKLAIPKEEAVCISLAGLFAPVDSTELKRVERELSLLLLHRLTHEPAIFVLERKQMDLLLWEKTLGPKPAEPFRNGTWIVEASFQH